MINKKIDVMTAKTLIETLSKYDPNTPIHVRGSAGDFPKRLYYQEMNLMESKDERWFADADGYYGEDFDSSEDFEEPFLAIIF